jgi:hypothetical protein
VWASAVSIAFTGSHPEEAIWQDERVQRQYGLTTSYRASGDGWIVLNLDSKPKNPGSTERQG